MQQDSFNREAAGPLSYRPDIDGLRAIAVLAVIGYHFFPGVFRAGFVGVDIFFVISGYLISGIILAQLDAGQFSLAGFYARRIRRIFPALFLVLLACAGIGWAVLYSDEYQLLGKHIAGGAGFVTNILLWSEIGYFDAAAETKPLLHLWSLGVEEQFYLLWPVVFAFLCRSAGARLRVTLAVLAVSLLACLYVGTTSQPAAFYLPMYRFWELMAGAVLAQRPDWHAATRSDAQRRSLAGLALLAACPLVIGPDTPFPGWRALLPVAGTWLIVSAGAGAGLNRVLSGRGLVAIGLISYPLYLWHWPLLAFLKIVSNDAPITPSKGAALLALSCLLAWLTYLMLERPIRTGRHGPAKAWALGVVVTCLLGVGVGISMNQGVPTREVNSRDPTQASRDGRNATDVRAWLIDDCRLPPQQAKLFRRCTRDGRGTEAFALIGDSKAEALFHGLVRTSSTDGRWIFLGGSTDFDSVLPVLSDVWHYGSYQAPSRLALRAVEENFHVQTVVIAAAARAFFHLGSASTIEDLPDSPFYADAYQGFSRYVEHLVGAGKKVVIVVDNPTFPDPKRCMKDARVTWHGPIARFLALGDPDPRCEIAIARHEQLAAQYRKLLDAMVRLAPGRVVLFETLPYLCDMASRRCGVFDDKGAFLYSFADHVSDEASTRIGRGLNAFLLANTSPAAAKTSPQLNTSTATVPRTTRGRSDGATR